VAIRTPRRGGRHAIKVAICITGLEVGGAETTLAELLAHRPDDLDVRVYSLIDGGRIADQIAAMGIEVVGMHMRAHKPSLRGFFRLWGQILTFRPTIVHTWLYHADLMGGVAARLSFVPHIIWHLHNSDLNPERVGRMTRLVVWICARLSGLVPEVILSCSEAGARVHAERGYSAKKIVVVPNGVDAERFAPSQGARASVREEFGLADDMPLVGLVARIDPQKDHPGFFRAVRVFFERGGDAHFLLAGRDVTEEHWQLPTLRDETGRPDRVTLAGPREDIPRLMAAFDISTSSSLGEAFPLAVIEAMACGVPCVATDVGDCALMIGDTGIVVPPSDADALAEAWGRLLVMPSDERHTLGAGARERVLENYTIESFAERMWGLYRELGLPSARRR